MAGDTIPHRLLQRARQHADEPAYCEFTDGNWQPTSWACYGAQVEQAGRALIALGFDSGQTLCILGFNRPEWAIIDVASMGVGGVPAGIYTTCSAAEVAYIVGHAEATVIVVENEEQWLKVQQERHALPLLRHVVTMRGAADIDDDMVMSWDAFMAKGNAVDVQAYRQRVDRLDSSALATLIYTSGTTGAPKGVMLSHHNLSWTTRIAEKIIAPAPDDRSLSYLPLSHIAEQMFTIHVPITNGYRVYFAESLDAVPDNLKSMQPTIFFGVPRIWEKFHAGITAKLNDASGVKAKLVKWAMQVGLKANEHPGGHRGLQYRLAKKLVFSKLKPAIGLGSARVCVTGAAPISREILAFFASLDVVILEVYGQSEDSGPTSFNTPSQYRFGSAGPAVPGVKLRIADDGEILVSGPNVFMGYYKDPEASKEALADGWLHSGDLGCIDADGFLNITGRKKDIIITAGGKNIAPKKLEAALKNHGLIDEAIVVGDRRKFLTALVTIDAEAGPAWAAAHGEEPDQLPRSRKLKADIQAHIDTINSQCSRAEQIKKFNILSRNLTIGDGELTPTLKVKRAMVRDHFAHEISEMYAETDP